MREERAATEKKLGGHLGAMASKVSHIPGLSFLSPPASVPARDELEHYVNSQKLARRAAMEVAALIQEGWSEIQVAELLNTCLADYGVTNYFHKAFVWFGERTRFRGVRTYFDYMPSKRVVLPGEAYILDVAPIVNGYICDIGYSDSLGANREVDRAKEFLKTLRSEIPDMVQSGFAGSNLWETIDQKIKLAGYDNIHASYPFSVLGHRVHQIKAKGVRASLLNFGWQSYWSFLSRGLFGQLLNQNYTGDLCGLWAIEPHIGGMDFGAKFEELLLVDKTGARWLDEELI